MELTHGDKLFYCYFERNASRKLWSFFIRMFDTEEQSKKFQAVIMIGHSGLERIDYEKAGVRYWRPCPVNLPISDMSAGLLDQWLTT